MCVTTSTTTQIMKGADCTSTTSCYCKTIPLPPQPTFDRPPITGMSAWSSTSSVATRTNTDNPQSMSMLVTNFSISSSSKKQTKVGGSGGCGVCTGNNDKNKVAAAFQMDDRTKNRYCDSAEHIETLSSETCTAEACKRYFDKPSPKDVESSRKKKVKQFKSTAV